MGHLQIADVVEIVEATYVVDGEAVLHLDYMGSAHILAAGLEPKRVLSHKLDIKVPLFDLGPNPDLLTLGIRLIVAVVESRGVLATMARYVDTDVREMLTQIDGRGLAAMSSKLLVEPSALARMPRWNRDSLICELPIGWVVGISALDSRKPIVCVQHEGLVGLLARDPMIAGACV